MCRYCNGEGVVSYLDAFDTMPQREPCQGCGEAGAAGDDDGLKTLEKEWEDSMGRAVP
jgi:DnaJ-class molecular chaperone